jgi:hypothetical protein
MLSGSQTEPLGCVISKIDKSSSQWFERTKFGRIDDGNFSLRRSAFDQTRDFDERLSRGAPGGGFAMANTERTSNLNHSMGADQSWPASRVDECRGNRVYNVRHGDDLFRQRAFDVRFL